MQAADSFRFCNGSDPHWWIVLSDPAKDREKVLTVNMTTWSPRKDQSCLLNPGDHPEVQHNSVLSYADARVRSNSHLDHLINSNQAKFCDPVGPDLLVLARKGAIASRFMALDHKQILINQGLAEG